MTSIQPGYERSLFGDPNVDAILPTLAESARRLANADLAFIALTDGPEQLRIVAVAGERRETVLGLTLSARAGSSAVAIRTGLPYVSHGAQSPSHVRDPALDRALADEQIAVMLVMPIKRDDEVIGVFRVASRTDREFTDEEKSLLALLAEQAAVSIGNARLYQREREARAEADALAELGRRISASLNLDDVLRTVAESARSLVAADLAQVGLADAGGTLEVTASTGERGETPILVIPPGKGVTGRVMASGEPFQVLEYAAATGIEHDRALDQHRIEQATVSALGVPIIHAGDRVGALLVFSRKPRHFQPGEIAILERLAAHAAIAIENARSLAREREARAEADALAEIGQRISASLDLDTVLQTTAECAHRLLRADATCITFAGAGDDRRVIAAVGNRTPLLQQLGRAADRGIGAMVLTAGRPLRVHWDDPVTRRSSHSAAVRAMATEGICSSMAVPIRHGSVINGVFWVHSRTHRAFTLSELTLLGRLAAQAGLAIANAQSHAEEQAARAEVAALLAATASLGAQAEPDAVLRTLIEQAAALLEADWAHYAVLRDGHRIIPGYWDRGIWLEDEHEVLPDGIARVVWETGRPYRTNDNPADPYSNPAMRARFQLRSQLTVPLLGPGQESIGLVSLLNSRRPEGFNDRDERLLVAICETGATILLRANESAARLEAERAAARRKEEVEALLEAADQLNSAVELEEVLRGVVSIAAKLLAVERVGIATNEGDHLLRRHTLTDGVWRTGQLRLPLDGSIAGWVVQHGRPFRRNDSSDVTRDGVQFFPASDRGMPARVLAVPILGRDGRVLGSLQLFDPRDGGPFTDDDQRLAEGVAHHAAVAIERAAVASERAALVEELRRREDHLRHQAVTDPLTGLPNRTLFLDRLEHAFAVARARARSVAVLFLDLDGFKVVNDSLGHAVGDILLQAVARRLTACQRASATVARFGGDEFAVLVEHIGEPSEAIAAAQRILAEFGRPFAAAGHGSLFVTASIGIAFRGPHDEPCAGQDLIREADIALYQAKAAGKGRATLFAPAMGARAVERLALQTDLQRALGAGELRLAYQPIVRLDVRSVVGAEALVRWLHPSRGLLDPDTFVPLAEETGLILPIGGWVLEEACRQAVTWQSCQPAPEPLRVSVNLSAHQFERPDLARQIAAALRLSGLDPRALELEMTETAVLQNPEAAVVTLSSLQRLGVRVGLDDFGTGYSSLSYLQRLPVDTLKIDRSFTAALPQDRPTTAIVQATIAMAHALGIEVTAEGIESAAQLDTLTAFGCDYGQGYYLCPPLPPDQLPGALRHATR